jgi:glycosyltransferase involved in cell wall biosynthesis
MVALEALASKTPFIISNVGGMAEIIQSNKKCILVDKITPETFAELLLKFFENKLKINKDEESRINIQDYNWDKIFDRMLN